MVRFFCCLFPLVVALLGSGCDAGCQEKLHQARDETDAARAELQQTKADLDAARTELEKVKGEVEKLNRPRTLSSVETLGAFTSVPGESGAQAFGKKYVTPPNVSWQGSSDQDARDQTILVEITCEGFKWKNTGDKQAAARRLGWRASGVAEK
jgi:hypothetical protein